MIGQIVKHYTILEKLGEGGMGIVYKAQDTKLDRPVALKFLPQHMTSDAVEKERFVHEARAASALNHPNITTIYEIDEFEGKMFIAMEYCEGRTLRQIVESEHLSIKKVLDIGIQACEGLALAHEKGIVHRDIKSDNIMLTPRNQVKIMDFGLAKLKGAGKLTRTGSTLGTASYMSPEQAQGEDVDRRSDIFSFGIVLYELLTRQLPFRGEHQSAMTYSIINEDPQPLARFNNKVSPRLEEIIAKALAKDRDERYQHIDDLLADLRREKKALEYVKTGQVTTAVPVQEKRRTPMSKVLKYGIPVVALVALVVLMLIFNPFNLQMATQKTVASEQHSVAVMYFENIPDPEDRSHTGEMLVNLLITSLSQAKGLDVISRERLYDIQKDLGHGEAKSITPSLATQIAQRAGVKTMLLGSVLQQSPSLVVTARLIDVQSGKILGSERLTGYPGEQIFALVDTLSGLVQDELKVGTSTATREKSVAEVTTTSPEAYRSYVEGIELELKFYFPEAQAALERAVELDKNFAMAYFELRAVKMSLGDQAGAREALEKAWGLSHRVADRERLVIEAAYVSNVQHDYAKAAGILEQFQQKYPHETLAATQLQGIYIGLRDYDRAKGLLERALAANPFDKALLNFLAYVQAGLGQRDEALRTIDRYITLAPAEPNPYDSKGEIFVMFGEPDSAVYWFRRAIAQRADFTSCMSVGQIALIRRDYTMAADYFEKLGSTSDQLQKLEAMLVSSMIPLHRGRFNEAREGLVRLLSSKEAKRFTVEQIGYVYEALINISYEMADNATMMKYASEYSQQLHKSSSNTLYGRDFVAWAAMKSGESDRAVRLLNESAKDNPEEFPETHRETQFLAGLLAYERGNYDEALTHFRDVLQREFPNHMPQYFYAVTLLKTGRTAEAIQEFQRMTWMSPISYPPISLSGLTTYLYWPLGAVKAHYWLGVAYEQQGEKAKAIKEYEWFLETWKDAEKEWPEMADAKARLTKLKQGNA
jgi:serine/threonine protein kinase/tetratricopeptide (TPR) repeat protein